MKKILILTMLAFGMIAASYGQTVMKTTTTGTKAVDTTDNSETNMLIIDAPGATYSAIQVIATKISGTPNGKLTFQVSMDGTNFVTLAAGDTAHVSNVAGAQPFIKTFAAPTPYKYYRVYSEGRGTASYKITALFIKRTD
jgi:hypothetical protein